MTTSGGWAGLLQDGEEILWQGQPDSAIVWRDAISPGSLFGVVFAAFALFWMAMASSMISDSGAPGVLGLFPLFGLPFLLVGLYMMGGNLVIDAYRRSNTWYTLTDRTAFIATEALGRRTLDSYPLREMQRIRLIDGAPGSVVFAHPPVTQRSRSRNDTALLNDAMLSIGFRRIPDARAVYGRMRGARTALTGRDAGEANG